MGHVTNQLERMEVGISEFKAKCIQMLKATAAGGEELVVTLRGKPLVRVVGVDDKRLRVLGGQPDAVDRLTSDDLLMGSDPGDDWDS